jgi:hypothetical protein
MVMVLVMVAAGGALGFLTMWHPALATNPFGLVAVVVAVACVVGLLGVTKVRVGITLLLMTLSTLVLVSVWALCGFKPNLEVLATGTGVWVPRMLLAGLVCACCVVHWCF